MARTDKVCFDRVPTSQLHRPHPGPVLSLAIGPSRAAFQIAKLWPNDTTLRIRFLGGSADQQAQVERYAVEWSEYTKLPFEFGDDQNAQIRIAFADDGAWSYIGTDALDIPRDQPTMNFGWVDQGVIRHEFGHMIGMIHEHQNPRANPIVWNKEVVYDALGGPPNYWDRETVDHNLFAKYDLSQINGSDFDPKSVMLYSFPASWTTNGFHTEPNDTLSDLDRQFAAHIYQPQAPLMELAVAEATEGEIGQPGEEDLYTFTAKKAGRYTVETEGDTDVVMTLFGPGDALMAQDDDSGVGRNAKVSTDLLAGAYKVQVRHYNSRGGTGKYGIRVSRS
jgi:hypothetical protein